MLDERIHGILRRHNDVVAGGAGGEFRQHFLVVAVIVLHQLAFAEFLETQDRAFRDVVIPVVKMQRVFGSSALAAEKY